MSNFMWWNDTITIFNRVIINSEGVKDLIKWYGKKLKVKCFWDNTNSESGSDELSSGDSIVVRIPKTIEYVNKMVYDTILENAKSGYFTLNEGDIVCKGDFSNMTLSQYGETGTIKPDAFMDEHKGDVIRIRVWKDNTGAGRPNPHYRING